MMSPNKNTSQLYGLSCNDLYLNIEHVLDPTFWIKRYIFINSDQEERMEVTGYH